MHTLFFILKYSSGARHFLHPSTVPKGSVTGQFSYGFCALRLAWSILKFYIV